MFDDIKYKSFSLPLAFFELTFFRTFEDIINKFFSRSIDKAFNLLKKSFIRTAFALVFLCFADFEKILSSLYRVCRKKFPQAKMNLLKI